MKKNVYHYHPQTGEFLNEAPADESPLEPGVILLPAFATTIHPPTTNMREVATFSNGGWLIKADWRGVPLYSITDGRTVTIVEIGATPAEVDATDIAMPSPAYSWKDGAWQLDAGKLEAQLERAKLQALAKIHQLHADTVQKLVGNPTEVEKDTWALKLEVANTIITKEAISTTGQAFLHNAGLTTDAARSAWAASVLAKSAKYAQVVGIAEKLRDIARAAVRTAKDEVTLKAALDAQRAAADEAVDRLLADA